MNINDAEAKVESPAEGCAEVVKLMETNLHTISFIQTRVRYHIMELVWNHWLWLCVCMCVLHQNKALLSGNFGPIFHSASFEAE